MARNIKVLIAEDHNVVREGLRILISADPAIEIAGEADNGEKAVKLAKKLQPDVVLMDLAMPKSSGLEATRSICAQVPASKVLILSAYQDEDTLHRVLEAGVTGYMTKNTAADELLTAIREVGQGRPYYSPSVAGKIRARRRNAFENGHVFSGKLTPREQQVLVMIAQGQPNKGIAYNLKLSIKTIEKHRQAAMDKLGLHDIAGLTRYAISKGWVPAKAGQPERLAP
jgi:DNA-binding NarL/FixJ family response regulator